MILAVLSLTVYRYRSYPFYGVREYPRLQHLVNNYMTLVNELPPFDPDKVSKTDIRSVAGGWTNPDNIELLQSLEHNVRWVRGDGVPGWYNFALIYMGKTNESAKKQMPRTMQLLEAIPSIKVAGLAILMPHTTLGWHMDVTGKSSQSMAVNIGLCSPHSTLYLQGGNGITYTKQQKNGEAIVFDSNLEHKVVNFSDKPRIILYIDFSDEI